MTAATAASETGRFVHRLVLGVCIVGAAIVWSRSVSAQTLDQDTCLRLNAERAQLQANRVPEHIARGPVWARDNLSAAEIEAVRRYISVEERLRFECPIGFDNAVMVAIRSGTRLVPPPPVPVPTAVRVAKAAVSASRDAARTGDGGLSEAARSTVTVPLPARRPAADGPSDARSNSPVGDAPIGSPSSVPRPSRRPTTGDGASADPVIAAPTLRAADTAAQSNRGRAVTTSATGQVASALPGDDAAAELPLGMTASDQAWHRDVFGRDR
ncbi:MAG: hypothetical protein ACFCUN_06890 [Hyphomicrobiaceae bacterium]